MFRRKRRKDSIDLDELKVLREASPAKAWVNLLLLYVSQHPVDRFTLQRSKGIPPIPLEEEVPEGDLDFDKIVNRLKVLCGLDPVVFSEPRIGQFSLSIHGVCHIISTTFVDLGPDSRYEIAIHKGSP